jgi:hypothetical protein
MSRKSVILFALLTMALASATFSCSGSQATAEMPSPPDTATRATLAGPLCETAECQCSDDPSKIGIAAEGLKRFRVELGPSESQIWATINKNVLYKGVERARACFYIDLPSGEHPITLRATGEAGFGAGLRMSEVGGESDGGPWFYESFNFNCGAPGLCSKQALRDWRESISHVSAGKHAPCGSVRILGIDWTTGRVPDMLHPEDFLLEATMKIYKFLPHNPPGTESCTND